MRLFVEPKTADQGMSALPAFSPAIFGNKEKFVLCGIVNKHKYVLIPSCAQSEFDVQGVDRKTSES